VTPSIGIAAAKAGNPVNGKSRRMPRPSKMGLTEEQRVELLSRESQECGPAALVLKFKAVAMARVTGDPRLLAGALDDLAACAVNWRQRTLGDAHRRPAAGR
jgi:hypothetical protein